MTLLKVTFDINLITPLWYTLVAHQVSLVKPWIEFWPDTVKPKYPGGPNARCAAKAYQKRYN